MKMTYEQYVIMVNDMEHLNQEEFNFFMTVETISDVILYHIKNEETLEQAIEKAKQEMNPSQNELEVAIESTKEQLRLFKICEETEHDFVSEDYANTETGYTGAICKRCGFSFGTTLY